MIRREPKSSRSREQLPITGAVKYGKVSSAEFSQDVSWPTRAEVDSLLELLTEYSASFLNLDKVEDPTVFASVRRSITPFGRPSSWVLTRGESGSGCTYEIACNDQSRALELLIEWATAVDVAGPELGGHEWKGVERPDLGEANGVSFEWGSQPLKPLDAAPFEQPVFFEVPVLSNLLKTALASAWEQLRSQHRDVDISGFGLDTIGDPFLLPTAFLRRDQSWVPAESSVHLVGSEAFDGVNEVIESAMTAFGDWEDSLGELDELGQLSEDLDEMEVYQQMCLVIFETGIRALSELRSEGLFVDVPVVVLNLWHMETKPTLKDILSRCNPPKVAERYLAESRS